MTDRHAAHLQSSVFEAFRALVEARTGEGGRDIRSWFDLVRGVWFRLYGNGRVPPEECRLFVRAVAAAAVRIQSDGRRRMTPRALHLADGSGLDRILDALDRFDEADPQVGAVFRLHWLLGLSVSEISLVLGISERAARCNLFFARRRIMMLLDDEAHGM